MDDRIIEIRISGADSSESAPDQRSARKVECGIAWAIGCRRLIQPLCNTHFIARLRRDQSILELDKGVLPARAVVGPSNRAVVDINRRTCSCVPKSER